jgi:N-acetyl sugar amidotransferase
MQKTEAIHCSKCVLDTNDDPSLTFNSNGVCNHCQAYEKEFLLNPLTEKEKSEYVNNILTQIKKDGGQYDCIIGLSGGVDSSYLAYLAKQWGLKALLVHMDNGWNSELAVYNINKIVDYTGFDLYTEVLEWEQFKDLQLSYIKASVLDWEVPTDHIIRSTLYKLAIKKKCKHILSGTNQQTEFILPHSMRYNKADTANIFDIHKKFGTCSISKLNIMTPLNIRRITKKYNIQKHSLLNLVKYNKDEAKQIIISQMGWRDYGGKHYESIFTRFYQGYVLLNKFKIDKRKAHLSSLINSGQITKEEALIELKKPSYPSELLLTQDFDYVAKKFDMTNNEFKQLLATNPIPHKHYKQYNSRVLKLLKKWDIYSNPSLYINYLKRKLNIL